MADQEDLDPQQGAISEETDQASWERWVEEAFPDFSSRAYFLPPVYISRVPMNRLSAAGENVLVLQTARGQAGQPEQQATVQSPVGQASIPQPSSVQDSDVRDDAAMQRVLFCLRKLAEINKEILVGLSRLKFGDYLDKSCYAPAADYLPTVANLPQNLKQGDFDVLLIHREYGLVVFEVKAFGDNIKQLNMSQQEEDRNIRRKLEESISQLDKGKTVLSHLVSDIDTALSIRKIIAFPNLSTEQVERAISGEQQLSQKLCQCLGTADSTAVCGLCLCSDQLSDPRTPCDVSDDVLRKLLDWWQRCVDAFGPDSHMTCDVYKTVVARFCGPATTVTVPCITPPRLCVKTLGEAVSMTGEFYSAHIILFPEQVDLLNTAPRKLFLAGPPGTGKTVLLLLIAKEWLRQGNNVYILSTSNESRPVCTMLYYCLKKTVMSQPAETKGLNKIRPIFSDFKRNKDDMNEALKEMSQNENGPRVHVIADEVGPPDEFKTFCSNLEKRFGDLHLWAASCYHCNAPADWQVECLIRPLRSPPTVVREVEQDKEILCGRVCKYEQRGVPHHTEGPTVKRISHRGQGHAQDQRIPSCITCGQEVASFLRSLGVGDEAGTSADGVTAPPRLQYKDVLVLCWQEISKSSLFLDGLRKHGFPVQVMDPLHVTNPRSIKDLALASRNIVWVADGHQVRGLERKVVVVLDIGHADTARLLSMSRCTSQLVEVCYEQQRDLKQSGRESKQPVRKM